MNRVGYVIIVFSFWITLFFAFLCAPIVSQYFKHDTLNVFTWAGMIDPVVFAQFEKETGLAVNVSYFGSNEELIAKLLATKARGYDLIIPSDYAVEFLIQHDLLHPIDTNKLACFKRIDPLFLGHYFDRKNEYSVPIEWYVLGCGINKKMYTHDSSALSWDSIFNPDKLQGERLGLINDSRELIGLAVLYLYKTFRPINEKEMYEVQELLRKQRYFAEAYTDFRGDFLLESGNASIVLMANSFALKSVQPGNDFDFVVPSEGTFLQLENCVIPRASHHVKEAHQLIDFLLRYDIQKHNYENATSLTTTVDADFLHKEPAIHKILDILHKLPRTKLCLFENFLTDDQVNTIWVSVKSE